MNFIKNEKQNSADELINNFIEPNKINFNFNENNKNEFRKNLEEELNNFHYDLMSMTSDNEELIKIQELILHLTCSEKNQASYVKCTYYLGEIIENIQYLKTTNSIYNVGMIFELFTKISNKINDHSNNEHLLKIYEEIQELIEDISKNPELKIEISLLNFKKNNNFIAKIIVLLETSKVIKHYKKILVENEIISSVTKIYNPNALINLVAIESQNKNSVASSKIQLIQILEFISKKPSILINLIGVELNHRLEERYSIR